MTLVLRGGALVDGTGSDPLARSTVVVDDGRITSVSAHGRRTAGRRRSARSRRLHRAARADRRAHAPGHRVRHAPLRQRRAHPERGDRGARVRGVRGDAAGRVHDVSGRGWARRRGRARDRARAGFGTPDPAVGPGDRAGRRPRDLHGALVRLLVPDRAPRPRRRRDRRQRTRGSPPRGACRIPARRDPAQGHGERRRDLVDRRARAHAAHRRRAACRGRGGRGPRHVRHGPCPQLARDPQRAGGRRRLLRARQLPRRGDRGRDGEGRRGDGADARGGQPPGDRMARVGCARGRRAAHAAGRGPDGALDRARPGRGRHDRLGLRPPRPASEPQGTRARAARASSRTR